MEVEAIEIDPEELFAGGYEDASVEVKKGRDDYCYVYWTQAQIYNFIHDDLAKAARGYEIVYHYQHDPSYFVFTYYADALRKVGKIDKAELVLHNSLTRLEKTDYPNIYWSLGWYAHLDGDYEETVHWGEESYVIDPELAVRFSMPPQRFLSRARMKKPWGGLVWGWLQSMRMKKKTRA